MRVVGAALSAGLLALVLVGCSGDDEPEPSQTQTATTTPASTSTSTPTVSVATPAPTETSTPTETTSPESVPTEGAGPEELAEFLPQGFPVPAELAVVGTPTASADAWQVTFMVPDPAATFDFYRAALPEAGYELLPGTSDAYSSEVLSGAILAQSEVHDVNLLVVDDEVELAITLR